MSEEDQPVCALCGQTISEEERDFCLANARFNGQVFCSGHQKRFSACPAMRWQPGGRGSFPQAGGATAHKSAAGRGYQ